MKLVIVESPGKVKKIQGFLGPDFQVRASFGHVRDLPEKEMGLTPPDFKPRYVPTAKGKKVLAELSPAIKTAEKVYLAADPDREGEAIAWHLAEVFQLKNPERLTFSEITQEAVTAALRKPRPLDLNLVRAQEARRGLDRLTGFMVSPELSRALGQNLSAGRVQSPALRLVTEREAARRDFKTQTHYGAELTFISSAASPTTESWRAEWDSRNWLDEGGEYFQDQAMAENIAALKNLTVAGFQETENLKNPPPPFTTSSLQQAASVSLKLRPSKTMELAQALYEAGAITYMRTDSQNLSAEAVAAVRALAAQNGWPLPPQPRTWKSKEGAQEAHEAIRPTHFEQEEAGNNEDEKKLYRLIRLRALAGQLAEAVYAVTRAELEGEVEGKKVLFIAQGRTLVQPGWRAVLSEEPEDDEKTEAAPPANPIPKLQAGDKLSPTTGKILVKTTKIPPRYSEASLIRELEKRGLGRPSTYAAILENLLRREYVKSEQGRLAPTPLGEEIVGRLAGFFGFLEYEFTRNMENRLDEMAAGKGAYLDILHETYETLNRETRGFTKTFGHLCPQCGKFLRRLVKKEAPGQKGYDFWGCSGYPACKASFKNLDGGRPDLRPPAQTPPAKAA